MKQKVNTKGLAYMLKPRPLLSKPQNITKKAIKDQVNNIKYFVYDNCVHIEDSYLISDKNTMQLILENINLMYPNCNVFKRSEKSLLREWKGHNRLYKIGLFKKHTKDVDLEYPQKWYIKLIWIILGL